MSSLKEPEQNETREIHVGFKTLLSAINKPNKNYELKTANRLYEEKTFPLIQVSYGALLS